MAAKAMAWMAVAYLASLSVVAFCWSVKLL